MTTKDLGMVTAYAYAVMGGYEGTEAEFEALLGNIATDLEEIENLTVIANTLPEGSSATASYADGVLTLGIPKGDTGATGAGATATVGTTTTGDPGTNASVTNSGTTKDAVFNFTIPRGATGNGIESIYLTGTSGAVKTYTILFTDGTTTTFDVTDGEVTNASLAEVLEDYAKVDGAYESMTVGNAEQLISSVTVNDKVPYNFRTSGGSIDIGDREVDKLVGGTVAWNQLVGALRPSQTKNNVEYTNNNDGTFTLNGTADATDFWACAPYNSDLTVGHKICFYDANHQGSSSFGLGFSSSGIRAYGNVGAVVSVTSTTQRITYCYQSGAVIDNVTFKPVVFDLTQMFGSTIADYIYSLETATAGAGVAWFKKLFPKDYYPYNAGELMSVKTSAHQMVGFNQWDEEWELGLIDESTGQNTPSSNNIRSKNYIPVCGGNTYYFKVGSSVNIRVFFYDADKNPITLPNNQIYHDLNNATYTAPQNARYLRFRTYNAYGTTYKNDICINLHWDGERDGEYEAYKKNTYPLDSDLELRGIPKLDASNNLYYDGDTYESDGTVTRKYGIHTFDGTETLGVTVLDGYSQVSWNGYLDIGVGSAKFISNRFVQTGQSGLGYIWTSTVPRMFIGVPSTVTTQAEARQWFVDNPTTVIYPLAEPTTEEADPYQNPQIVDDFGTEEYVDERTVAIPVGHDTEYMNNLKAKLEMAPDSPDGDGDYIVRQTNGENSYVPLMKELPTLPSEDGTYLLKCTVSGSTKTLGWVEEE